MTLQRVHSPKNTPPHFCLQFCGHLLLYCCLHSLGHLQFQSHHDLGVDFWLNKKLVHKMEILLWEPGCWIFTVADWWAAMNINTRYLCMSVPVAVLVILCSTTLIIGTNTPIKREIPLDKKSYGPKKFDEPQTKEIFKNKERKLENKDYLSRRPECDSQLHHQLF